MFQIQKIKLGRDNLRAYSCFRVSFRILIVAKVVLVLETPQPPRPRCQSIIAYSDFPNGAYFLFIKRQKIPSKNVRDLEC